jgi:hypothetical protein
MLGNIEKQAPLALRVNDFCQRIRVIRVAGRTLIPFAEVERILSEGVR